MERNTDGYIEVGEVKVQDRVFTVLCRHFTFFAVIGETRVWASNEDGLKRKIVLELARQRVEHNIPVILEEDRGIYRRAVLRGAHARTNQYLFTLDDGKKEQMEQPRIVARGEEITDEDLAELNRLSAVAGTAAKTAREFLRAHSKDITLAAWKLIAQSERAAGVQEETP